MQTAWTLFVEYGAGPVFLAALYHPIATICACFGFAAAAIWKA